MPSRVRSDVGRRFKRTRVVTPLGCSGLENQAWEDNTPEAPRANANANAIGNGIGWPWRWPLFNATNKYAPHAGKEVHEKLMDKLTGGEEEYRRNITEFSRTNTETVQLLRQLTMSPFNRARMAKAGLEFDDGEAFDSDMDEDEADDHPSSSYVDAAWVEKTAKERSWFAKMRRKEEFLMSIAARHHNRNVKSFVLVTVSLMAFMSGVPRATWAMLAAVGAIYSYTWTRQLALDLGERMREWPGHSSTTLGFAVGDNCAYAHKKTFEHRDVRGQFIETVNWLSVPVVRLEDGTLPELPTGASD